MKRRKISIYDKNHFKKSNKFKILLSTKLITFLILMN